MAHQARSRGLGGFGGHVSKTQIGLVNIAGRSDVPIGLVNIVAEGVHDLEIWGSDTAPSNLALKLGGCHVYSVFALAAQPRRDSESRWMLGLGLGGRVPLGGKALFGHRPDRLSRQRRRALDNRSQRADQVSPRCRLLLRDDVSVRLWPGFFAGIRI